MEAAASRWDVIIFGIYGYLIYDVASHWSDYDTCHSPIQIFLLLTYCAILVHRVVIGLKSRHNLPWLLKKCVSITFYWIMNPLFLYITVQGIVWQVENDNYTPGCVPETRVPWMIWWWVVILILVDLLLILISVVKIVSWWRVFMFRRRARMLMSQAHPMSDLNQILLNISQGNADISLNDQVGLEMADIDKIPKTKFVKSLTDMLQFNQDSCPICFEEYQNDVDVTSLPSCEHIFHSHCIQNWLVKNPLCPICRANVRNNLIATMNKEQHTELTEASL